MLNFHQYPEMRFPDGFVWGSATAAHQIEGDDDNSINSQKELERGYQELSGRACNGYELCFEDARMLQRLGQQAYRFSIPWSRIEPSEGQFSAEALRHYVDLLIYLKELGIKTFVTLLHGSAPIWFGDKGGFLKRENVSCFEKYVEHVVPAFSPYVDYWLVINELNLSAGDDLLSTFETRANYLVAHARGTQIIKAHSSAPVGSAHALQHCHPENPFDEFDQCYARWNDWIVNGFFFHALRSGEIVFPCRDMEYIPELKDSFDYWAMNYYCRRIISARSGKDGAWYTATHQKMIDRDFYLEEFFPEGLTQGLQRLRDKPVYVTENGVSADDDRWRIVKLAMDLAAVWEAGRHGVDVRGYLHWSTMDNYEWSSFVPRFGLVHVDFSTFERTPKPSAYFFQEIIAGNGFDSALIRKYLPELPEFKLYGRDK